MSWLHVAGNGGNRLRIIDASIRRYAVLVRLSLDISGVPTLAGADADNRFERRPAAHTEEAHTRNPVQAGKSNAGENLSRDRSRQVARLAELTRGDRIQHRPKAGTWSAQRRRTVCRAQKRLG